MAEIYHLTPRLEEQYEDQIRFYGRCQDMSRMLLENLWLKSMGQMELFNARTDEEIMPDRAS